MNREADLSTPSEDAATLAAVVLVVTTVACAAAAANGEPAWAILASPFFLGALVGLFAIWRPVRAVVFVSFLGLVALTLALRDLSLAGVARCAPVFIGGVAPLMIIGAVSTATLRRRLREHGASPAAEGTS
jgi:hypothetical protein